MKDRCVKFSTLMILVCFCLTTILPAAALARPGERSGPGPGPEGGPKGKAGPAFRHVPPGGHMVRHGGGNYFFYSGRCYRHGPDGYFWVRPPAGIVAYSLPAAAVTMLIGGLTYYVYDNVYYRRVPAGYQVVPVPTQTAATAQVPTAPAVSTAAVGAQVVVTAKILNVRSGPSTDHNVVTQTYMGNILIVQGVSPDWYYVRLPDNSYGWVMKGLVTIPGSGAQG